MYEKNAYETLRWVTARSYTGVDTWTLMMKPEARQKTFLDSLIRLAREEGVRLWTTDYALKNVEKMLDDENYADTARRARAFVMMMRAEGWMQVFQEHPEDEESRFYHNPGFLAEVLAYTCKDAALLTQESGVACEVLNRGGLRLEDGRSLRMFRITGNGKVGRFNFLRDREGRFVLPKNSGLHAPAGTPVAKEPSQLIQVCEALVLYDEEGNPYPAQTRLDADHPMAPVVNQPEWTMALVTSHIHYAHEKCRLLMESGFPCPEAILPEKLLYDEMGTFAGYLFHLPEGVSMRELFEPEMHLRLRNQELAPLDREWYAALAVTIAQAGEDFRMGGVSLLHLTPDKIRVGLDENGRPDSSKVYFLRMEEAQFGTEETGMFPASRSVGDSSYAAPELRNAGASPLLYGQEQLVFTVSMVCLYALLGVDPCGDCTGTPFSFGAISRAVGEFDYPVDCCTAPASPQMQNWQALNQDLRQFFYDLFCGKGRFFYQSNRPPMNQLLRRLRAFLAELRASKDVCRLRMQLPEASEAGGQDAPVLLPADYPYKSLKPDLSLMPGELWEPKITPLQPDGALFDELPAQRPVRNVLSRMLRWLADRISA